MCVMCDGSSLTDVMEMYRRFIDDCGFAIVAVDDQPSWTYTIGLLEKYDHPELVVTGLPYSTASQMIWFVVNKIKVGQRFDETSELVDPRGMPLLFGKVAEGQWAHGRFNMCLEYAHWAGHAPDLRALQVVWANEDGDLPPGLFCKHHRGECQPLLDIDPERNVHRTQTAEPRSKGSSRRRRK